MNKRLLAISEKIGDSIGFADVGTDHGYLPVYMLQNSYSGNVIASDINEDPLRCAVNNAREAGFEDKIRFILCDGIDRSIEDDVDTIIIAGMGGDTICGIIDRAEWVMDSRYKLILQPMSKAEILRYFLAFNDFEIFDETLIGDGNTVYQLICARYGKRKTLSDAELYVGSYELSSQNKLFSRQLDDAVLKFKRMTSGLGHSADRDDLLRLELGKEIYSQLLQLKERYEKERSLL